MATISARIDPAIKSGAVRVLGLLGMTTSQAISLYFKQIIYTNSIPFEIKIPNKLTLQAIKELESGKGTTFDSVDELLKDLES